MSKTIKYRNVMKPKDLPLTLRDWEVYAKAMKCFREIDPYNSNHLFMRDNHTNETKAELIKT